MNQIASNGTVVLWKLQDLINTTITDVLNNIFLKEDNIF